MSEPIRILLVEDNKVYREALELLLGLRDEFQVVGSVGDGTRAVEACRELQPDVMVVDYRLPGLDGVQTTAAVLETCPDIAVVCLTASASRSEMEALEAAGAVACLRKDQDLDEILEVIRLAPERLRGR